MLLDGDNYPKYGSVGTYGIQGTRKSISDITIGPNTHNYDFMQQHVYNIDSSNIIRNGGGFGGAHNDIAHPEIAHVFWQAVL